MSTSTKPSSGAGPRWGISLPFGDVGLAAQIDQYRQLADAGYTDFWTLEASGWDAFTPLAMMATALPDARFGTAIVPAFTRGAATLAGHAAALSELFGDRFTLGLGASTPPIVRNWNGLPYEEPFKRTRDTLRFLRAALAGEKVTEEYETFSINGYKLDRPPAAPPSIMVAALRPGMLRLAGSEGDGALLSWAALGDIARIRETTGTDVTLGQRLFVCPSTDREQVLAVARRQIVWYATTPAYRAFHEWAGRTEPFEAMWKHWEEGDRRGAVEAIPEHVVDDLVINGSPAACVEHVERFRQAGVTLPLIHVIPIGTSMFEAALSLAPTTRRSTT